MTVPPARRILIATRNPGKTREIVAVLTDGSVPLPQNIEWCSLDDLPQHIPEPAEDGSTFADNAALKARYYSRRSGLWTLADDSGLEVDALAGAPGVHSARYAGLEPPSDRPAIDAANNRKLIAALAAVEPSRRTARFRCCLALADGDHILAATEGVINGKIIDHPRGRGGFGYDPHFFVPELGCTTAELPAAEKNRVSHRGQALRRMAERLAELLATPNSSPRTTPATSDRA